MVYDIFHKVERLASDRGDGIGDGDAGEAAARGKRIASDRGDGIGDGDGFEAGAVVERRVSDRGDGIGNGNICYISSPKQRRRNSLNTISDSYSVNICAKKRQVLNSTNKRNRVNQVDKVCIVCKYTTNF